MVILHIVTVSIYYDEKVKTNKQGGLNKLRGSGKFFQIRFILNQFISGLVRFTHSSLSINSKWLSKWVIYTCAEGAAESSFEFIIFRRTFFSRVKLYYSPAKLRQGLKNTIFFFILFFPLQNDRLFLKHNVVYLNFFVNGSHNFLVNVMYMK